MSRDSNFELALGGALVFSASCIVGYLYRLISNNSQPSELDIERGRLNDLAEAISREKNEIGKAMDARFVKLSALPVRRQTSATFFQLNNRADGHAMTEALQEQHRNLVESINHYPPFNRSAENDPAYLADYHQKLQEHQAAVNQAARIFLTDFDKLLEYLDNSTVVEMSQATM